MRDEALELSRKSFDKLLPLGLATPDNYFFTIRDSLEQVSVGMLWITAQDRAGRRIAYVYDVSVKPEHQRKGMQPGPSRRWKIRFIPLDFLA